VGKKEKSKKTDVLRNIGKQFGESIESVLKKIRKAMVGRICKKKEGLSLNERVRGDGR